MIVGSGFGMVQDGSEPKWNHSPQCQNQEPYYGPVLADTWTMDWTTGEPDQKSSLNHGSGLDHGSTISDSFQIFASETCRLQLG
jgi:hypothetical protein